MKKYIAEALFTFPITKNKKGMCQNADTPSFSVCSAWLLATGCKSPMSPNSGNHTANSNGVPRELESERSWRQISGLTNRNFI